MKNKYFIGVGLNLFETRAVLLKEDGKVVFEIEKKRSNINANETITVLLELLETVFSKAKKYKDDIKRIGLALGGIVNSRKGVVYWPQEEEGAYAYVSLPLKDYLEKSEDPHIVVFEDFNLLAK